jgi:hypothetical protein
MKGEREREREREREYAAYSVDKILKSVAVYWQHLRSRKNLAASSCFSSQGDGTTARGEGNGKFGDKKNK